MLKVKDLRSAIENLKDETPVWIFSGRKEPNFFGKFLNRIFPSMFYQYSQVDIECCSRRYGQDISIQFYILSDFARKDKAILNVAIHPSNFPDLKTVFKTISTFEEARKILIDQKIKRIMDSPDWSDIGKTRQVQKFLADNENLRSILDYAIKIEKTQEYQELLSLAKKDFGKVLIITD